MPGEEITGLQKAAIFFLAVGEDLASEVLRLLEQEEITKITSAIHDLRAVSQEQIDKVLEEFSIYTSSDGVLFPHAKDYVQKVLVKTVGNERARSMLRQFASSSSPSKTTAVKMALDVEPKALARLIGDEQPQVIALILSHVDAKLAGNALMELPQSLHADVVSRMAKLGEVPPDVMEDVQDAVLRKVKDLGSLSSRQVDGMEMAAELLNNLDKESWNAIMVSIKDDDSRLAEEIGQRMFTFEDLAKLDDRTMQVILGSINPQSLATALKGTSRELQEKVFNNLSQRAGEMLKEDMEVAGPVRQKEVFKVQREVLESVKRLEEEGKIEISSSEEDVLV